MQKSRIPFDLRGIDVRAAARSWFDGSNLPDADLTPTEVAILWIKYELDLTQAMTAGLLGVSYQRVSFLEARALTKLRAAGR